MVSPHRMLLRGFAASIACSAARPRLRASRILPARPGALVGMAQDCSEHAIDRHPRRHQLGPLFCPPCLVCPPCLGKHVIDHVTIDKTGQDPNGHPVPEDGHGWAAGTWPPRSRIVTGVVEGEVRLCGAMDAPSGSSTPVSSKITTPLQSRLQPCSGWLTMVCAASRSGADAHGQGGECGQLCVPPGRFIVFTLDLCRPSGSPGKCIIRDKWIGGQGAGGGHMPEDASLRSTVAQRQLNITSRISGTADCSTSSHAKSQPKRR
jgi:hypothetical protein